MTDLTAKCPHCGKKTTNYFHFIDRYGMSTDIPDGTHIMYCYSYYNNEDPLDFCGKRFKIKVTSEQHVKVLKH